MFTAQLVFISMNRSAELIAVKALPYSREGHRGEEKPGPEHRPGDRVALVGRDSHEDQARNELSFPAVTMMCADNAPPCVLAELLDSPFGQ